MDIIPAIDLINGKCVRLYKGDFNQKKEYNANPLDQAFIFKDMGTRRIHIVDLDGASDAKSENKSIIKKIKKETGLIVETGGGIRTKENIDDILNSGIDYVILGTVIAERFDYVSSFLNEYKDKLIAGIDVVKGEVKTRGWKEGDGINAFDFGKKLFTAGFSNCIFTDITKDGTLSGPNLDMTCEFCNKTGLNAIVSGGIGSEEDIKNAVSTENKKIIGVIIGKAYYEDKINLKEIINLYG